MVIKQQTIGLPPTLRHTMPALSYKAAMRLKLGGVPVFDCDPATFSQAIESLVTQAAHPASVRDELRGHDFKERVDRWHAILILGRHKISYVAIFQNDLYGRPDDKKG